MTPLEEQLAEALRMAQSQVKDLRILLDEASELGFTIFVCGCTYKPEKIEAALAAYEQAKAEEKARKHDGE